MKTILVPIDFSRHSENAFRFAEKLASVKGMRVKLIHIIEDAYELFDLETKKKYFDQLSEIARNHLETLAKHERETSFPIEYRVEPKKKSIAKTIAAHEEADLIVMGKVGINHQDNFPLGSTASRILRSALVPVITVGEIKADFKIEKIVFASDFKEDEVAPIVDRIIRLAELLKAELHLVKIETEKVVITDLDVEKFQLSLGNFNLKGLKVKLYADRNEEEGILNYANNINADLIAICTHGRNPMVHILKGGIAEHISIMSQIPVLTYNISSDHLDRTVQPISRENKLRSVSKTKKKE